MTLGEERVFFRCVAAWLGYRKQMEDRVGLKGAYGFNAMLNQVGQLDLECELVLILREVRSK